METPCKMILIGTGLWFIWSFISRYPVSWKIFVDEKFIGEKTVHSHKEIFEWARKSFSPDKIEVDFHRGQVNIVTFEKQN